MISGSKAADTRKLEEAMARRFSSLRPFSEHLSKWEDPLLPDKYDHNCFEYTGQPSPEEFEKALRYQKASGASFIKLEGDAPLADAFGLEAGVTETMVLYPEEVSWMTNEKLCFGTPALAELEAIELKHFGPLYGEDFSVRNVRRQYEGFEFHGGYLDGGLVASCYSFSMDGMTCIDGLIVDDGHRHRYIATSLIAHIKQLRPDDILVLHADEDDTPREMYLKMGFRTEDKLYEYLRTDL